MKNISKWLAALLAAATLPALAGQYSDLWWNPQESGWGLNVVQQGETAFVTLYVYGPDGRPTWYVASDAQIYAYAGVHPQFRGTLYRTEGPWHGGPYDPSKVRATAVGQLWLEVTARDRMRVHYHAEGTSAVKDVVRQSFAAEPVAAWYASQFVLRVSRPGGPPIGTSQYQAEVLVHLDQGDGFIRTQDHLGRVCHYRGPYAQSGKLIRFTGAYVCSAGESLEGTFEMADLEVSPHAISGSLRKFAPEANESGRFAAVRY